MQDASNEETLQLDLQWLQTSEIDTFR